MDFKCEYGGLGNIADSSADAWCEAWWLVVTTDCCCRLKHYIVNLDIGAPEEAKVAAGDGDGSGDGGQGEAEAGERADTPDSVKMTGSVTSSGTEADSAMSQV